MIELEDLLQQIRAAWPSHWARGRILHIHQNAIRLADGSLIHLRVMVQELSEAERHHAIEQSINDLAEEQTRNGTP